MVKVIGKRQFFYNLDLLSRVKLPQLYKGFIKEVMTMVLRNALIRTPVDTGFLRASGRKTLKGYSDSGALGEVSYHAPYATYVHEILTNYHPVGEAKYLENAISFMAPLFIKLLHSRVAALFNRRIRRDMRIARLNK